MSEEYFNWTQENAKKFFHLRLQHEWLFKKKKQAWKDFYNILLENGFPKSLTMNQIRKKWQYTVDTYKEAKKTKNKKWLYYKIFDKYLGKNVTIDKYEPWSDKWRLKLIDAYQTCYQAFGDKPVNMHKLWREVETELRSNGLPTECCIQDIQGLMHYLKVTFRNKYRVKLRKNVVTWPLYDAVHDLLATCHPDELARLEMNEKEPRFAPRSNVAFDNKDLFLNWNRDMTESFIQIKLQHEWLFREKKQPWIEFAKIMLENGYTDINPISIQKKWQNINSSYQKALASNNKNWIYYHIFSLYAQETDSVNPLKNWQEHWVKELIHSRCRRNHLFSEYKLTSWLAWREVEKDLRTTRIPLDHSLLDIVTMWKHLKKTYRWKSKFAAKGILNEAWPYYEAMEKYSEIENKPQPETMAVKRSDDCSMDLDDGFDDEDIKPLCYVNKIETEDSPCCRACGERRREAVSLWGQDQLALKLSAIAAVEIEQSDGLAEHICLQCSEELEAAYNFRAKCQSTDKLQRLALVKIENGTLLDNDDFQNDDVYTKDECDAANMVEIKVENAQSTRTNKLKPKTPRKAMQRKTPKKEKSGPKKRYEYKQMCDICGKNVAHMKDHLAAHLGKRIFCDICGKSFQYKSAIYSHMMIHLNTTVASCNICGKGFRNHAAYRRHYAYHEDQRRFTCSTCGKGFNSPDILKVHMYRHTGERPHSCSECGKPFRTMGCVGRHKRIVHKIHKGNDIS